MPTVEVDGHELYYELRGSGQPLLAIMRMSGTHRTWGDPFLEALAREWSPRIAAFNEKYNYEADGHAAERVVEAFFTD